MKFIFSLIIVFISSTFIFGQKYLLDSTDTHSYLKLTSYPFIFDNKSSLRSFCATGPSVSVSGERVEFQLGILYDFIKYEVWHPSHFGNSYYTQYRKLYCLLVLNYNFHLSKKINFFPSIGIIPQLAFAVSSTTLSQGNSDPDIGWGWLFAGGGVSYKANNKIKLSISIHEKRIEAKFMTGTFVDVAYQLK